MEPMEAKSFLEFLRGVIDGDASAVAKHLLAKPVFATLASPVGATRTESKSFFFESIGHYLYEGDTALHLAAAAFNHPIAKILVSRGANCRAKNRRGAQPIHYAADANRSDLTGQGEMIEYLVQAGANPNALDNSGVAPLHRAVRTRSEAAVNALLKCGANPGQQNKAGSTPLHLAVQPTGRGGSGSEEARRQQVDIIKLLMAHGAKPTDQDFRGTEVLTAAKGQWILSLLNEL
jgi:ankyrin repeat protein